jgi:hypothetical protein
MTDLDLHYLRSILRQLRGLRSFLEGGRVPMPSVAGEALADNIDWLDCFIAQGDKRGSP